MNKLKIITDADFGGEQIILSKIDRFAARGILYGADSKIAVMRMGRIGCHKLPGGGVEKGESPEAAFMREVLEETGYQSEITHAFGYIDEYKGRSGFSQRSYCYAGKATQKGCPALTKKETDLGLSLEWMDAWDALLKIEGYLHSFEEYTIRFMFLREATILRKALELGIGMMNGNE